MSGSTDDGDDSAAGPSPEQIVQMFPPIAQSLEGAAKQAGVSPTDMQSNFWHQALHSQ